MPEHIILFTGRRCQLHIGRGRPHNWHKSPDGPRERRGGKIKKSGRRKRKSGKWLLLLMAVVLTAGISSIRPAMALWSDSLYYQEDISTGSLSGDVLFTKVFAEDETLPPGEGWGTISTRIENEDGKIDHQITIDIDRKKNKTNWVCNSKIENRGTIPVRFLPLQVKADKGLEVEYDLPSKVIDPGKKGLDPGDSVEGQIRISLKTAQPGIYTFQIKAGCIQWNAYNTDPAWWQDTLHIYGTVTVEEPPKKSNEAGQVPADKPACR